MEIVNPPTNNPIRPRFQIFASGLAARHTFLLDTETGSTWTLSAGTRKRPDGTEYEVTVWIPFTH
jgi:hypothetical protein